MSSNSTPQYGNEGYDNYNGSYDEPLVPFSESSKGYDITKWGWISVGPILLVLGTFGNGMILATVGRVMTGLASLKVYLIGLAVSDTVSLYTVVLPSFTRYAFGWDPMSANRWTCKLIVWISLSSTFMSAWILVALTAQRAASVVFPHKVRVFCTHTKSVVVTVTLAVFSLVLYAHALYGMVTEAFPDPSSDKVVTECGPFISDDYLHFMDGIVSTVDLVIFAILPFFSLLVCNVALSWTLVRSIRTVRTHLTAGSSTTNTQSNSRDKKASSTTITVLALSLAYIVLVLPVGVMDLLVYIQPAHWVMDHSWLREVAFIPLTVNYAINFYIYCMTGERFRQEFRRIICCCVRGDKGASSVRREGTKSTSSGPSNSVGHNNGHANPIAE